MSLEESVKQCNAVTQSHRPCRRTPRWPLTFTLEGGYQHTVWFCAQHQPGIWWKQP